jgi:MFS family permease
MQYVFVGRRWVGSGALVGGGGVSRKQVDHEVEATGALVAGEVASSTSGEALRDGRYWLVFAIFAMLVSTGMLVNNEVVELAKAAKLQSVGMISSAFAVGNTLSRIFFGYCSDAMAKRIPRHWFLVMDSWLMCLAYFLLFLCLKQETAPSTLTAIAVFLGGFSFGAPWMMVPAIEMHWYGQAKFGAIHGIMMFATTVGLILVRVGETVFDDLEGVVIFCLVFALMISVLCTLGFLAKEAAERRRESKVASGA